MLQDYLVFGFDFGLRLQILRFFRNIASMGKHPITSQYYTPTYNLKNRAKPNFVCQDVCKRQRGLLGFTLSLCNGRCMGSRCIFLEVRISNYYPFYPTYESADGTARFFVGGNSDSRLLTFFLKNCCGRDFQMPLFSRKQTHIF